MIKQLTWQKKVSISSKWKNRQNVESTIFFDEKKQRTTILYKKNFAGQKSGLMVSILDSQLEGRGFESHPILDGNGVKAMPELIPAPNPGSFNN